MKEVILSTSSSSTQDNKIDTLEGEELIKIINYLRDDKIESYYVSDATNNGDNNIKSSKIMIYIQQ